MTMGDRICVMKDGDIMQVAEPLELYDNPKNLFVAGFIGSPPMNFFRGTLARDGGRMIFTETNPEQPPVTLALDESLAAKAAGHSGKTVFLGIRPENVTLPSPASAHAATAEVRIEVVEPMGSETFLYLNSGATAFIARVPPGGRYVMDQRIRVAFDPNKASLFDAVTGQAL
jgi:multiple sugar transport system ATP-binding protein